jgi:hypothetical protein
MVAVIVEYKHTTLKGCNQVCRLCSNSLLTVVIGGMLQGKLLFINFANFKPEMLILFCFCF